MHKIYFLQEKTKAMSLLQVLASSPELAGDDTRLRPPQ